MGSVWIHNLVERFMIHTDIERDRAAMWMLLQRIALLVLNLNLLVVFDSNHLKVSLHLSGIVLRRLDACSANSRNGSADVVQI